MAGILDSKSRIMDVIITEQGRRQIASGRMKIEYATFTDLGAFYSGDENDVMDDPTSRVYFEAASDLPSDMITFETDDAGYLRPFRSDGFGVNGENVVINGARVKITGSSGANQVVSSISNAIFESWQNLQVIGTQEDLESSEYFTLSSNELKFSISENLPFTRADVKTAVLDDIESLNHDFRLSKLENFRYLPPINSSGELAGKVIADFPNDNELMDLDQQSFQRRLSKLEFNDVFFNQTSMENNFVMQVFEVSNDSSITKLDVIDFGERASRKRTNDQVRTLFAGKIMNDSFGNATFVNIFTIELE